MKRKEWKERLPIITAYAEGKEIQVRSRGGKWLDVVVSDLAFSDGVSLYRIKPTPREFKVMVQGGLIVGTLNHQGLIELAKLAETEKVESITVREVL